MKWNWSNNSQNAFDNIKEILISDLLLGHLGLAVEIVVVSVTSEYSVGAIMLHKYKNGNLKVMRRVSHSLIATEKTTTK